jgi:hypothetical protein
MITANPQIARLPIPTLNPLILLQKLLSEGLWVKYPDLPFSMDAGVRDES